MKKCAILFTLLVILLIIASITDKANGLQEEIVSSNSEINYTEPMVNTSKVKSFTKQE